MKRIIFTLTILIACVAWNTTLAETKETRAENPHELRLGVGECTIFWATRNSTPIGQHIQHNLLTPHIFAEYKYRLNNWFAVGLHVNTIWNDRVLKSAMMGIDPETGEPTVFSGEHHINEGWFHIMPSATFTYFSSEWVNLYSGLALGYAFQTEKRDEECHTWHTFSGYANLFGISVGKGHLFGSFEIGALFTLRDFPSQTFSLSLGYRF